jgi:methylthioribose-1-phosphate isomerase
MRVKINGENKDILTIWREGGTVKMIDQSTLPHKFQILNLNSHRETANAIQNMVTRGAGAIGIAGGYGVAQAALEAQNFELTKFTNYVLDAANTLKKTRPTAINLFHVIDRCIKSAPKGNIPQRVKAICEEADRIALEDLNASRAMGRYGDLLIKDGFRILTHCNAGALAFIDFGSAIAPIRVAHRNGKKIFVYVDETRPRSQGAKLTTWELQQEEIPYALIVDNAAGYYLHRGDIDMVLVGADRIAGNGDTANKIGTYEKAVLAHENGIPFYVVAPSITFDLNSMTGNQIEIEHRSPEEVNCVWGVDEKNNYTKVQITATGTNALNPSFDITPAKYITGFITEFGLIHKPYKKKIKHVITHTYSKSKKQ